MLWWNLRKLNSPHSWVRATAATKLGESRDRRAIGPLINASFDENENVRLMAHSSLRDVDPSWATSDAARTAVPRLVELLPSLNSTRDLMFGRLTALIGLLGEIADPRTEEPLLKTLSQYQGNGQVFAATIYAIAKLGSDRAVRAILDYTDTSRAAEYGGEYVGTPTQALKNERLIPALVKALDDESFKIRMHAIRALDRLKWVPSEEIHRKLLDLVCGDVDRDSLTREDLGLLISALTARDSRVRNNAQGALDEVFPKWPATLEAARAVPSFVVALDHWDRDLRVAAAGVLMRIGEPAVAPLRERVAKPTRPAEAMRVLEALSKSR